MHYFPTLLVLNNKTDHTASTHTFCYMYIYGRFFTFYKLHLNYSSSQHPISAETPNISAKKYTHI